MGSCSQHNNPRTTYITVKAPTPLAVFIGVTGKMKLCALAIFTSYFILPYMALAAAPFDTLFFSVCSDAACKVPMRLLRSFGPLTHSFKEGWEDKWGVRWGAGDL